MENENSEIPAEIEVVKKESVESPTNVTTDNSENAPILQNEANTPSSHRPETTGLNADTKEEGNPENKESTENKENNDSSNNSNNPVITVENQNNDENDNVTSPIENNDAALPVKNNSENDSNDIAPPVKNNESSTPTTTLPEINIEENIDSPSNENNEPILSVESKNNNNNNNNLLYKTNASTNLCFLH